MRLIQRIQHLLAQTQAVGSRSITLMAPSLSGCAVCGKAVNAKAAASRPGTSSYAGEILHTLRHSLCAACCDAIPWLERIKCPICGRGISCEDCTRRPDRHFVVNRSAVSYDSVMRGWLALYKYRGYERLAPVLAEMLVPPLLRLTKDISESEPIQQQGKSRLRRLIYGFFNKQQLSDYWDAITYVPISAQRAEDRGFNQAKEMAAHLSERFGVPLFHLLVRELHSEKMSFKSRAERLRDVRNLFRVDEAELRELEEGPLAKQLSPYERRRALRILLVDDIYTTGSTVEACSSALLRSANYDLRIYVLTWSRS
ncbi:ComF family protein [Paenibacillus nanensis]|uniref:ComF family protein n=1 Tax=Paenibacillus nanensis TaxID=393251 RepID=A0A3A1UK77_9BACL|nr:ComF family protein [Paenibacillus nanensis]RIX47291.1 ComF family protein [Paenibacillus nanensis]